MRQIPDTTGFMPVVAQFQPNGATNCSDTAAFEDGLVRWKVEIEVPPA